MVSKQSLTYDPAGVYDVEAQQIEYLRHGDEPWLATVYLPKGAGPFPAILDVHGGAWNAGNRSHSELRAPQLAASGVVVVSIDFRLAPDHPYPAQVADVNYATRWLKSRAAGFNADGGSVGLWGSSSGGHTVLLSAMRPKDPLYTTIDSAQAGDADATALYVIGCWPIVDPYARYLFAQERKNDRLVASSNAYFLGQEAMRKANPNLILERGENVELPPVLIIQGSEDGNLPVPVTQRFAETYVNAGGSLRLEMFMGMPHGFGASEGREADLAFEKMKAFIASQVNGG